MQVGWSAFCFLVDLHVFSFTYIYTLVSLWTFQSTLVRYKRIPDVDYVEIKMTVVNVISECKKLYKKQCNRHDWIWKKFNEKCANDQTSGKRKDQISFFEYELFKMHWQFWSAKWTQKKWAWTVEKHHVRM